MQERRYRDRRTIYTAEAVGPSERRLIEGPLARYVELRDDYDYDADSLNFHQNLECEGRHIIMAGTAALRPRAVVQPCRAASRKRTFGYGQWLDRAVGSGQPRGWEFAA